ncbi:MAG: hypothetical protein HY001_02785 [Candidatus Portnoybacteria bacterium]|nr:hypothetical protein [Candidatus Portnoybacteria bacterium]
MGNSHISLAMEARPFMEANIQPAAESLMAKGFRRIVLALLAAAITFSGRTFLLGVIGGSYIRPIFVRWEDIVLVLLGIFLFAYFLISQRTRIKVPPILNIFLIWIAFELASSLLNAMLGSLLVLRVPFYTLKEIEYAFIFFYVWRTLKDERDVHFIMKIWLFLIWIHLGYIFYQFLYSTEQGIRLIGENGNFNIGGQFLILSTYTFAYFLFFTIQKPIAWIKKISLGILSLVPFIGVFTAANKASAVAGILTILTLLFFYGLKRSTFKAVKQLFIYASLIGVMGIILTLVARTLPYDFITHRTLNFPSYENSFFYRVGIWKYTTLIALHNPVHVLIGRGGADPIAEASHNQYVRNFVAGGIIGSLLFMVLVGSLLKISFYHLLISKHPLLTAFSVALFASTIGMLVISFSGEAFFIVRPAEHYWFFAGITAAVLKITLHNHKWKKINQ